MLFWIRIGLIAAIGALLIIPVLAKAQSATSKTAPTPPAPKPAAPDAARSKLIDINTAPEAELNELPKIGKVRAQAIIKGRPCTSKDDLRGRKIIPEKVYDDIKDRIVAHQH